LNDYSAIIVFDLAAHTIRYGECLLKYYAYSPFLSVLSREMGNLGRVGQGWQSDRLSRALI